MIGSEPEFSVSEFVEAINQSFEYAFNTVVVHGELANFRINRGRWVYFDLKDEMSKVAFFGSVYFLPGPLEDGMMVKVRGMPRLHGQYGFSVVFNSISAIGAGNIKRANELLAAKLEAEGLFASERKRVLAYPPHKVGLITSLQSAAFADFKRILGNRWAGVEVDCYDVTVQGDQAPGEVIRAIEYFSALPILPEVLVIIRGGGSPEELAAFSAEQVVRAVAASRVPTLVAIGHESDTSLSELAADSRASTPSNAAEILVPDKKIAVEQLNRMPMQLLKFVERKLNQTSDSLGFIKRLMPELARRKLDAEISYIEDRLRLVNALSPKDILKRGFAIVRKNGDVTLGNDLMRGSIVDIELHQASFQATINRELKELRSGE